jgi:AcrR family transcriptional regulator
MSLEKLETGVRREQIAEAALALIAAKGLGKLSLASVARRVGLVPSGIYRHFRNKDEIILAVIDRMAARMMRNVEAACEETADPVLRLKSLLLHHIRVIREGRAIPRIIFSDDFHSGHPERKLRVQRLMADYLGRIADLVRQGQQRGTIRPELEPPTVALMFLGMVVPPGILWHVSEGAFDVSRHAERAWQFFQRALVPDDGTPASPPK